MNDTRAQAGLWPPYIHGWKTSGKAAWICVITLAPIVAWSSALYGRQALVVWISALVATIVAEAMASALLKKWTLGDGSAVMTGLLIASAMPPGIPWYIPAVASFFAILVVKAAFGGLGSNWMNPALGGVAFAYANWPAAMREFIMPRIISGVDGVSASTPLAFAKGLTGGLDGRVMDALRGAGYPLSRVDTVVTTFLNDTIFSRLGARLPDGYFDMLLGFKPGAIGESALFLVLVGSIVLIALRLIKVEIPLAMLATFSLLARLFGTGLPGENIFAGDVLYALSGGGIVLAAFYMATDPVSSPVGRMHGMVYGAATGALCFVFRRWGTYTESVVYAILIMNMIAPLLERFGTAPRQSGRKARAA